jgi:site-specific recombinase XerD
VRAEGGQRADPVVRRERGSGGLFREVRRDPATGEKVRSTVWTMKLRVGGKPLKRSSGKTSRPAAAKELEKWKAEVLQGTWVPDADKTTFDDLATILKDEYKANGRRSADRVEDSVGHLRAFFGGYCRARAITTARVLAYVAHRKGAGAANATCNRELAALKRMFRLGEKAGKVARRPWIDMLQEANARKGFFEPDQFEAVLGHLPEHLRPVFAVAYITGWRVKSEILTRQRPHLDLNAGWLRLEPGETKNGEGRQFPLTPALRAVFEAQAERTRKHEQESKQTVPWLFHRKGKPIKSFRRAWLTACLKAGFAQLVSERPRVIKAARIPHDFRRTAVRNLERAGVPRSGAMAMVGHRTEAIYRRYAISDERTLREGAAKLQGLHDLQGASAWTGGASGVVLGAVGIAAETVTPRTTGPCATRDG